MKKIIILLCILYMPVPVADAQSYAADFLTLGTDARPLGMGNAFIAIADAAHTASYNPAGISQLTRTK